VIVLVGFGWYAIKASQRVDDANSATTMRSTAVVVEIWLLLLSMVVPTVVR